MRLYHSERLSFNIRWGLRPKPHKLVCRRFRIYESLALISSFSVQSWRLVKVNITRTFILLLCSFQEPYITMRLAGSFAVSALFLAAFARGTPASPGVVDRICQLSQGSSCVSPSQIDLSRSENLILGSCNWREWALCTAIAAGACFVPCEMGGYVHTSVCSPAPGTSRTDTDRLLGS